MSGIYGLLSLHGESASPPDPSVVRALAAGTSFTEPCAVPDAFSGAGVLVGAVPGPHRLESVASTVRNGQTLALAFAGSLYPPPASGAGSLALGLLDHYARAGAGFLRELRGDFCLALWDGGRETLIVATDPFRVRPVFYARAGSTLAFSSRLRALEARELGFAFSLEPAAVVELVASSYIASPRTIYREARKLAPGHCLEATRTDVRERAYWNLDFLHPDPAPEPALRARTRESFAGAVAARLQSEGEDVRVGAYLSGGIDSSTVTGVMTQATGQPVPTFSIGFGEARFNEINYARVAARAFGSDHREYFVTAADTFAAIPILIAALDEPLANASAIPAYYCARLAASNGVEVLYGGDGGDELFGGNERYAADRVFDLYGRLPGPLRRWAVEPGVALLARTGLPLLRKARRYIEGATTPYPERLNTHGFFRHVPIRSFFDPGFLETLGGDPDPDEPIARHWREAPAETVLDHYLYLDLKLAVSDNDLFKVTRTAEAAGVTVRYPFLDLPFVELATRVPARMKMRGRELRTFFKEAYADLLPAEIRAKQKHGFGLPIASWLRTDPALNGLMRDLVLSRESGLREYVRPEMLEDLVARHAADITSFYGTILWNLVMFELWRRRPR
ncbi:MAG TPA: asparagine synthase-related protein [Candidatus Eisenbacteria bacterium]